VITFNKTSNIQAAITEMYPQIPWELVADTLGPVQQTSEPLI